MSLLLLFLFGVFEIISSKTVQPGSAASHHLDIESHHSLNRPFDVSLPYWKYGGDTVCTESFIRLTPNIQSRRGWIFNEFELQKNDWEIELHFGVKSEYHVGGDGFGIWILNNTHHPRRNRRNNYLSGPIFGLDNNFQGFGVAFDTYDNDGNRDNPSIFSIKQSIDTKQTWDHDKDFDGNMLKKSPDDLNYKCTYDYRNKDISKVILRYINSELHVYVNKDSKSDKYDFCFSTKVGIDTKYYYIALTAMTGQVADTHDIYMLVTRYLDEVDKNSINDRDLSKLGYRGAKYSIRSKLFWLTNIIITGYIVFEIIYEWYSFDVFESDKISPINFCNNLNPYIYSAYIIHTIQVLLLIFGGYWLLFFLHSPIILWRGYQYMTDNWKLESIKIRQMRGFFDVGNPIGTIIKSLIMFVFLIISIIKVFTN